MKMIHDDTEATGEVVSKDVFDAVWAPRGWRLLGPAETYATELLGRPVKSLDSLKANEAGFLVAARGLPQARNKAEALGAFAASFEEADEEAPPSVPSEQELEAAGATPPTENDDAAPAARKAR